VGGKGEMRLLMGDPFGRDPPFLFKRVVDGYSGTKGNGENQGNKQESERGGENYPPVWEEGKNRRKKTCNIPSRRNREKT